MLKNLFIMLITFSIEDISGWIMLSIGGDNTGNGRGKKGFCGNEKSDSVLRKQNAERGVWKAAEADEKPSYYKM
ncbi:MAG: hypothetical protein Q4A39_04875 [Eubacteriales bacterium]|nr:hypothetical protein [Eubacteriales bacterium]